jgi:hypothetical protein
METLYKSEKDVDRTHFTGNMNFLEILTKWCFAHSISFSGRESIIITSAVNEYLTQFQSKPEIPTGEMKSAEEWFDNHFDCYTTLNGLEDIPALTKSLFVQYSSQFTTQRQEIIDEDDFPKIQNTPEWNKEQSKGIDLREDLILYHKWFEDEEVDDWAIHFVDKYLSKM